MSDAKRSIPVVSTRQSIAIIAALALHGSVPLLHTAGSDEATEKAVIRIGDELERIRSELVATQLETAKVMATAMQELTDHSRRLDSLETNRCSR